MKAKKLKRGLALMLGVMMAANLPASVATPFTMLNSYAYTGSATVKATSLNVRSGAGIVADSVPEKEFEECLNKARAVVNALELAKEADL